MSDIIELKELLKKSDDELVVLQTINITHYQLMNLVNGGTVGTDGLFSIRTVRKYETKTPKGQKIIGLELQIVTNGIKNFIAPKKQLIKKVQTNKPKQELINKPKYENKGSVNL